MCVGICVCLCLLPTKARRGCQIFLELELQMAVDHHVGAGS